MPRKSRPPIDRLERERNAGRLGLAAYGAACIYRAILRDAEPISSSARKFGPVKPDVRGIIHRNIAHRHQSLVHAELGPDAPMLEAILLHGSTFKQIAEQRGYAPTPRGEKQAGDDFRNACTALAVLYASQKAKSLPSRKDETYAD
jgi:hypothetical protein